MHARPVAQFNCTGATTPTGRHACLAAIGMDVRYGVSKAQKPCQQSCHNAADSLTDRILIIITFKHSALQPCDAGAQHTSLVHLARCKDT